MLVFAFAILLFIAVGVVFIVRRQEMAEGLAMFSGATTPPGCAAVVGAGFFALALLSVVLYRLGYLGPF
jgi:hypothetical protein